MERSTCSIQKIRLGTALVCAFLCLSMLACARPVVAPAAPTAGNLPSTAAPTASPAPTSTPSPSPTPTPEPTPEPTPTPAPTPRPIDDPWFAQRDAEFRRLAAEGAYFETEAEMEAVLARMAIDPDKPMVALTFDDGPAAGVTDKILDILEQYEVRATFFVLGGRVYRNQELVRRAVSLGCEIGNHTWGHDKLTAISGAEVEKTIARTQSVIRRMANGYVARSLRPPGGSTNQNAREAAGAAGMAVVLWSQSGNVNLHEPEEIAANVFKQGVNGRELCDGDIILLHDTHDYMIEAVQILVPKLLEAGYQLVTVQELLHLSEDGFHYGRSYRHQ